MKLENHSHIPAYPLDSDEPADAALRRILHHLLERIESNVQGVLDDSDPEFLHDLRVTTRRTRSALDQLRSILPKKSTADFRRDFRWLGDLTGPLRDFDVWLEALRKEPYLSLKEPVIPLKNLICEHRASAMSQVKTALHSARFRSLLAQWRLYLDSPNTTEESPKNAARPIGPIASLRIHKAYERILKRHRRMGPEPTPSELHKLRISAKKLRYLLEFFAGLYPPERIQPIIEQLKRLQDILGAANDLQIQQSWLLKFAAYPPAGAQSRDPAPAVFRLVEAALVRRLEDEHAAFLPCMRDFTSEETQGEIHNLFAVQELRVSPTTGMIVPR
ncbi:MAG: CHAD domain-containing protein [Thermoanaerobaculales bacterium]|nr:CHAD domain-containing protein [Thermoanaerobaculales bacterium]